MKTWILNRWEAFRTGFWMVPGLMSLMAIALAIGLPIVDSVLDNGRGVQLGWLATTAPAARSLLSGITGIMFTVLGIVYSSTLVTLSITASQFGSRLLRTFLRDLVTQVTLGTCVATGIYSLLVLRTIKEYDGTLFVPHLSVFVALILAIISVAALIRFVHQVAASIQASNVVKAVAHDLDDAIERLFPERLREGKSQDGDDETHEGIPISQSAGSDRAFARVEGHLQAIDSGNLVKFAAQKQVILELLYRPGDFIVRGMPLALVRPENSWSEEFEKQLNRFFIVGSRRTPQQDVECAIQELVELAVRALSPGINDPFTASSCIDRLAASLSRIASRQNPAPFRYDSDGQLRVIFRRSTFRGALDAAFNVIRQNSADSVPITINLLEALEVIATAATRPSDLRAIQRQSEMIRRGCEEQAFDQQDRDDILRRSRRVLASIASRQADQLERSDVQAPDDSSILHSKSLSPTEM